ncbi:hypothetical protein RHMOL_Rhmol02G0318300 [Rhododendron molle]|uniref:Uncharacterized protein n=4 Tax=Rhododendron molle TaxID=49168 RepID=A0ACC0PR97_RHOML|nr:hypothetical protein RHMOL_Rhmol07G0299500 [Rhododendron molle]KAI8560145.1 hypothetical protein RHMOL_Rhmol04G0233100 [Rhododendron molle]KAI8567659.1 hypothetical protein RHMOL_Rhmol02G0139000 [Rhododendron molle]KAI8569954.1 hypothetical protein RHMOL_Rhmol02G0318300 [Rhododendron molle]
MKAHSWPLLQNNLQQPEESHASPVPDTLDNQTPGSEPSVNNDENNQNYEWLRDEVIELVRILKSTAIGNRLLTDALEQNTTLTLLRQCNQMVQSEIDEAREGHAARFERISPQHSGNNETEFGDTGSAST